MVKITTPYRYYSFALSLRLFRFTHPVWQPKQDQTWQKTWFVYLLSVMHSLIVGIHWIVTLHRQTHTHNTHTHSKYTHTNHHKHISNRRQYKCSLQWSYGCSRSKVSICYSSWKTLFLSLWFDCKAIILLLNTYTNRWTLTALD